MARMLALEMAMDLLLGLGLFQRELRKPSGRLRRRDAP
jgi:hypothetical protein